MGRGRLTGRVRRDEPLPGLSRLHTTAQNWLLSRFTVSSVIVAARTESQLVENLPAVGWPLDDEQSARLDAVGRVEAPYPTSRITGRRVSRC